MKNISIRASVGSVNAKTAGEAKSSLALTPFAPM